MSIGVETTIRVSTGSSDDVGLVYKTVCVGSASVCVVAVAVAVVAAMAVVMMAAQ